MYRQCGPSVSSAAQPIESFHRASASLATSNSDSRTSAGSVKDMQTSPTRLLRSGGISTSTLTNIAVGAILVCALYFGRQILVPVALAILLSFVLSPPVRLLQGKYFPRGAAVGVVAIVAFAVIFGLGTILAAQVHDLAKELPQYQATLEKKIETLRGATTGAGTLERASRVLQDLKEEIEAPREISPATPSGASPPYPVPVEIRQPNPGALQTLAALISPLIDPLTTTGIVVIFVIFILFQQKDLRNRLIRLMGAQDLQRTTAALDDAGERLSRLFLTQLALNAIFGFVIGIGLWVIGVPSAPLWGMMAMILRFVPYIGGVIAAIFPLILAASIGPGWTMVLWTGALFLIVEPITGQIIEPLVYGRNSGLSPVAIVACVSFWTWLWGPIGLILATPLTICLAVLGRHIDRLNFLEVLFGDEPPLTPAELIYQRMLARDPVEIAEQANSFLKQRPVVAYFDEVVLPGLRLAAADADKDLLDAERLARIRDAVAEVIDDLTSHEEHAEIVPADNAEKTEELPLSHLENVENSLETVPPLGAAKSILCLPGQGLLDEAVGMMIAHLLERRGINARFESADALSMSGLASWNMEGVELVCLCYIENVSAARIRYAVGRIRRKSMDVRIIVALLGDAFEGIDQELPGGVSAAHHTTADAIAKILAVAIDQPPIAQLGLVSLGA
jgi:predicted PurR-regulated permease PerM